MTERVVLAAEHDDVRAAPGYRFAEHLDEKVHELGAAPVNGPLAEQCTRGLSTCRGQAGRLSLVVVQEDHALGVVVQQSSHQPPALGRLSCVPLCSRQQSLSLSYERCQQRHFTFEPGRRPTRRL